MFYRAIGKSQNNYPFTIVDARVFRFWRVNLSRHHQFYLIRLSVKEYGLCTGQKRYDVSEVIGALLKIAEERTNPVESTPE